MPDGLLCLELFFSLFTGSSTSELSQGVASLSVSVPTPPATSAVAVPAPPRPASPIAATPAAPAAPAAGVPVASSRTTPEGRLPIILFAVIDNSGSMQSGCGGRNAEDDEFSRLDLVKHTLNTTISAMDERDQICIIKFSSVAKIFAPLTRLTDSSKQALMTRLDGLLPEGQTNIWDGLRLAIDEICQLRDQALEANIQIYLLTDGEPTINPPRPLPETLENYLRVKNFQVPITVNTFGYGYSLDSRLLYDIAKMGRGSFGYIPDSSMVGTVFINALSHSLIQETSPLLVNSEVAQQAARLVSQSLTAAFLSSGSPRSVVTSLARDIQALYNATLETLTVSGATRSQLQEQTLQFLAGILSDCMPNDDPNLGQVDKAVNESYFHQWGKHYLFSVLSAYENYVCINFKDKGMQFFRHDRFIAEQTRIENIFIQIPPPRPTNCRVAPQYRGGGGAPVNMYATSPSAASASGLLVTRSSHSVVARPATNSSMSRFIDVHGGCFSADSLVCAVDGSSVTVGSLSKGSLVWSNQGATRVEAVIKLRYNGPLYRPLAMSHMLLTAYHPVLLTTSEELGSGSTHFPRDLYEQGLADQVEAIDGYVYDVILENRGILATPTCQLSQTGLSSSSAFVATWAHTCTLPKFAHAYFGSESIVRDLQRQRPSDYAAGFVLIDQPQFLRGLVSIEDSEDSCVVREEMRITQLVC